MAEKNDANLNAPAVDQSSDTYPDPYSEPYTDPYSEPYSEPHSEPYNCGRVNSGDSYAVEGDHDHNVNYSRRRRDRVGDANLNGETTDSSREDHNTTNKVGCYYCCVLLLLCWLSKYSLDYFFTPLKIFNDDRIIYNNHYSLYHQLSFLI